MLLNPLLLNDFSESVLHGHRVGTHHAVGVDVQDIYVVKGMHQVGTRDDLTGFVEGNFGERELLLGRIVAHSHRVYSRLTGVETCCRPMAVGEGVAMHAGEYGVYRGVREAILITYQLCDRGGTQVHSLPRRALCKERGIR